MMLSFTWDGILKRHFGSRFPAINSSQTRVVWFLALIFCSTRCYLWTDRVFLSRGFLLGLLKPVEGTVAWSKRLESLVKLMSKNSISEESLKKLNSTVSQLGLWSLIPCNCTQGQRIIVPYLCNMRGLHVRVHWIRRRALLRRYKECPFTVLQCR
jgi:hypothetical protein